MLGVALEFKNYPNTTTPVNATNLNDMQKLLIDLIYPVGTYYHTSDSEFDPNTAWGGTWILEKDGTVLVSKSSTTGSKFNDDIGTIVGEEEHILVVDEMPSHKHQVLMSYTPNSGHTHSNGTYAASFSEGANPSNGTYPSTDDRISNAGGNQSHNNVQPSKIINRWHRTA